MAQSPAVLPPRWVVVTVALDRLADSPDDRALTLLSPPLRHRALSLVTAWRALPSRDLRALALARFIRLPSPPSTDLSLGVSLLARWLAAVPALQRRRFARTLDADARDRLSTLAKFPSALSAPAVETATWLAGRAVQRFARLPTTRDWSLFFSLLSGANVTEPVIVGWERSARIAGRERDCFALLREVST